MSIARKSNRPAGIVNASGQPEIELTIGDLKFTTAPPAKVDAPAKPATEPTDAAANSDEDGDGQP